MANVIEIPATKTYSGRGAKRILNVGAYARVSTEAEQQAKSFEIQVEHYTNMIKNTPGWRYVDIYGDEHAIIGTSGENLVKSRVSALVPFNFFVKGKYNFI